MKNFVAIVAPVMNPARWKAGRRNVIGLIAKSILLLAVGSANAFAARAAEKPSASFPNLAARATIRAASSAKDLDPQATVSAATDGNTNTAWIGGSPNEWYGLIHYPSLTFSWDHPQQINTITLTDQPELSEHAAAAVIAFDDGYKVQATAIPNDGRPLTLNFPTRQTKSLTIRIVDGIGGKIGLSEVVIGNDPQAKPVEPKKKEYTDYVSYVDPTIETSRGRWFYCTPASRPFGLVGASAYTRNKNQCGGGYNYNSTEILGFANIHCWIMSGVNLMPVTGNDVIPNQGEAGWKSPFSHETEIIEPGYHKVFLDRYQTQVEYTSTERTAFYRIDNQTANAAKLLLQLGGFVGADSYVDGKARLVSPTRLEGSHGLTDRLWGGPQLTHIFFVMEFNRPITGMDGWKDAADFEKNITDFADPVDPGRIQKGYFGHLKGKLFTNRPEDQAGVVLHYEGRKNEPFLVKIGISYTSIENARKNLEGECPHWNFDEVRQQSRAVWNEWLGKIDVKGGSTQARVKFYTDLWHVLLGRHKIDDLSGDYPTYFAPHRAMETAIVARGTGKHIEKADELDTQTPPPLIVRSVPKDEKGRPRHHMYNSDALWLTMWNLNILWGLGWPEVMDEFSASFVEYARRGGCLPRGPSGGGYTGIMRGCPATSLITATWQKGLLTKTDAATAYEMMKQSHPILIRDAGVGEMVQGAFEYWALAQMAGELGRKEDLPDYAKWIDGWRKYYEPKKQLLSGTWVEANDWQGTFGVSHDIPGLAKLMGGNDALAEKLNEAFERARGDDFVSGYGNGTVNYANQPGLSSAHVFNHVGHPWLSQYWVRRVSIQAYGDTSPNEGYGGHDEDQGQMGGLSALMKIGLFSLCGTSSKDPQYEITTPEFDEVTIKLDPRYYSGKEFKIICHNQSPGNGYIQSATLNGAKLNSYHFPHETFAKGGTLELHLGPKPNKSNWTENEARPPKDQ